MKIGFQRLIAFQIGRWDEEERENKVKFTNDSLYLEYKGFYFMTICRNVED